MMTQLPTVIDPLRFARKQLHASGQLNPGEMRRISALLENDSPPLSVSIALHKENHLAILECKVKGELLLLCQRCLDAFVLPIEHQFTLGCVRGEEEASKLPSHVEPLILDDERLLLANVVEDELLLLLPLVPMHAEAACEAVQKPQTQLTPQMDDAEEKENPFAVLKTLRKPSVD